MSAVCTNDRGMARVDPLSGHLGERRPVVPGGVPQRVHERIRHPTSTFPTLVVAVIVQDEGGVQIIAAGPVPLPIGKRIGMRGEELESGVREVFLLLSGKNTEAVDPNFGLGGDGFVVGVEGWREGIFADSWQVWKCEVHAG